MRLLFTVTIFLGSALLFLVEPMVAKLILPKFGGAPAVWTAAMLFFQCALLLGYGYAHLAVKWLGPRRQSILHVALVLLGLLFLPISLPTGTSINGSSMPALSVLIVLSTMIGGPFLILSAGAPLVQRWFAQTKDPLARDPYFLYSASNLGSMVALLAYPFLVEPNLGLAEQARLWKIGYGILAGLLLASAILLWRSEEQPTEPEEPKGDAILWRRRLKWIALAAIPSSLLLSVTTHITTIILPAPLLWVIPLAFYLLSFILAFARHPILESKHLSLAALFLAVAVSLSLLVNKGSEPGTQLTIHIMGFLFLAWACHRTLAEDRPQSARLTEFFFFIALGGVVGGAFNSIIAPTIFNSMAEYPIGLVAAALLLPRKHPLTWRPMDLAIGSVVGLAGVLLMVAHQKEHWSLDLQTMVLVFGGPLMLALFFIRRPIAFSTSLAILFVAAAFTGVADDGKILSSGRSFFGVHQVFAIGPGHMLYHGTTIHGAQFFDENRREPISYYAHSSPIGQLMAGKMKNGGKPALAVVGLGAGTMAVYGQAGQQIDFYEIDPTVIKMAQDPTLFTYLTDTRATIKIHPGDARISLQDAEEGQFDIILLDAFSSDAIPVHLLTREAIELDLAKLAPHGVIAFHISNRYLRLRPVLAKACQELHLANAGCYDPLDDNEPLKYASDWVMVARDPADLESLTSHPDWEPVEVDPKVAAWTDDRSSVLPIFNRPHFR